jgi:hypothetical protein
MLSYVNVALAVEAKPAQQQRQTGSKQNRGGGRQSRPAPIGPQNAQLKAMGEFFQQLTDDVEREGTRTILLENEESKYRAIITRYQDFLRDRSMAELLIGNIECSEKLPGISQKAPQRKLIF